MHRAIFLSASIPDPNREPHYAKNSDPVAIAAAVSALIYVTLGRRLLVWGGHPAITPMIWVVAEELGVQYGNWVRLYQSKYFKDQYPEDNNRFQNVTYIDDVAGDRGRSLTRMRERMFSDYQIDTAIFVGGMSGIIEEHDLLISIRPNANVLPILSTGGATLDVARKLGSVPDDLQTNLDYVALFHRHLGIPAGEQRYASLDQQPGSVQDRLWKRKAD